MLMGKSNGITTIVESASTFSNLTNYIMKKLMMSMAVALFASVSMANASAISTSSPFATVVNQEKVEIKPEELPDPVKAALAAEPYNAWQVQKAFQVPGENGANTYEVALVKGEETSTAKFDKDGKVIE